MNNSFNVMLAASSSPGFVNAIDTEKTKIKERLEESKYKVNSIICLTSIIFYAYSKSFLAMIVNMVILVVSAIVNDSTFSQLVVIMFSPIKYLQKAVFGLSILFDRYLVNEMKDDQVITVVIKACKYSVAAILLITTF